MSAAAKPLTLVSGYLGTGKTTLINHVLASGALGRAAVVVNDFGSVNIDAALIRASGADTIELTNGCICCQITDDVQRTMTALAARDDLDHVVCEVSGIGNPAQLGAWRTHPGFRPGGVVVCVDAGVTLKRLRDEFVSDIVHAQIRAADLLVVTKADSVSSSQLARVKKTCVVIAGDAPIEVLQEPDAVRAVEASPKAGRLGSVLRQIQALAVGDDVPGSKASRTPVKEGGHSAVDHSAAHHSATVDLPEGVSTVTVVRVLDQHAHLLVRAKGCVRTSPNVRAVVQLAGRRVMVEVIGESHPLQVKDDPDSLVLIAAGPWAAQAVRTVTAALMGVSNGLCIGSPSERT